MHIKNAGRGFNWLISPYLHSFTRNSKCNTRKRRKNNILVTSKNHHSTIIPHPVLFFWLSQWNICARSLSSFCQTCKFFLRADWKRVSRWDRTSEHHLRRRKQLGHKSSLHKCDEDAPSLEFTYAAIELYCTAADTLSPAVKLVTREKYL